MLRPLLALSLLPRPPRQEPRRAHPRSRHAADAFPAGAPLVNRSGVPGRRCGLAFPVLVVLGGWEAQLRQRQPRS